MCICACRSDRVQIKRLLTLDEEQPLDGNWLTKCSSRCIQITVFNFDVPLVHPVPSLFTHKQMNPIFWEQTVPTFLKRIILRIDVSLCINLTVKYLSVIHLPPYLRFDLSSIT